MTDSNLKFKGYVDIKDSLHRKSYYSFLSMGKDIVEYHLESSLELDGRFYGAEWKEEYEKFLKFQREIDKYIIDRFPDRFPT